MNTMKMVMLALVLLALADCVVLPYGNSTTYSHSNSGYYGSTGYYGLRDY
ncbi:MAG: hypothetical protein ABSC26_03825 [Stellaceae bacterium]